jgi:predicted nucleic acid-binding protein
MDDPIPLVDLADSDMQRICHSGIRLNFVDAAIVALAERLGIRTILTADHRDFLTIRPRHCGYFEMVP